MAPKILIAFDGSDCAKAAVRDLSHAGLPRETEALVLSVAEVWIPPKSADAGLTADQMIYRAKARELAEKALADARETADECKQLLRKAFPGWAVSSEAYADTARVAILDRAETWRPNLIVLGSHGRSALGRLILGSASQSVLHHARCTVRIGRGPAAANSGAGGEFGPARLVIGVDGSPEADAVIRHVASRKWPAGSSATVITAFDLHLLTLSAQLNFTPAYPSIGRVMGIGHSWARQVTEQAAARLRESGLAAAASVIDGEAKQVLLREAQALNADCIFVGAHGLGRVERFLVGSVSSAVAARAHCSVEVVRPQ